MCSRGMRSSSILYACTRTDTHNFASAIFNNLLFHRISYTFSFFSLLFSSADNLPSGDNVTCNFGTVQTPVRFLTLRLLFFVFVFCCFFSSSLLFLIQIFFFPSHKNTAGAICRSHGGSLYGSASSAR